ncbi:hypothetical protein CCP2SC5_770014 [Azospirillaceae bacterium]
MARVGTGCLVGAIVAVGVLAATGSAWSREVRSREVHPYQLMSFAERHDFWSRVRSARTSEERRRLMEQKYADIQMRAAERGVTLIEPRVVIMTISRIESETVGEPAHRVIVQAHEPSFSTAPRLVESRPSMELSRRPPVIGK